MLLTGPFLHVLIFTENFSDVAIVLTGFSIRDIGKAGFRGLGAGFNNTQI